MPKNRGDELLIHGNTIVTRSRDLGTKELLGVLPDLRSVCAKREPQSNQVRLEVGTMLKNIVR